MKRALSNSRDSQVITTPFFPGYLTPERIAKAPKLKLALTAGIGSDHVDLEAASEAGITVAEVTGESLLILVWCTKTFYSLAQPWRCVVTVHASGMRF